MTTGLGIAVTDIGPADGPAVMLCHGLPGTRALRGADSEVHRCGIRLLACDRPGIGGSAERNDRDLAGTATLLESIARNRGVSNFGVVAHSAGVPVALALAAQFPETVGWLQLVGAPPIPGRTESGARSSLVMRAAGRSRWLVLPGYATLLRAVRRSPDQFARWLIDRQPSGEQNALERTGAITSIVESFRLLSRSNARTLALEAHLVGAKWGIDLSRITQPTRLWYGTEDHETPAANAAAYLFALPNAQLELVKDQGHISILFTHWGQLLQPPA